MRSLFVAIALCLVGCTPFRYYPLPVSSGEARATFAPIATAANGMGYKYWRWDDSVGVQADPMTRISWMFDASNNYVVCVQLMSKTPRGGLDAGFAAGKHIADDIWQRAMALRASTQVVVPTPSTTSPITNYGDVN